MINFFKLVAILFFLSDNYVNLSNLYVNLSDNYVNPSDPHVDPSDNHANLSDIFVDLYGIMMKSKWQLVALTRFDDKMLSLYSHYDYFLTSQHKDLTSQEDYPTSRYQDLTSRHSYLTSGGRSMPP